MARDWPVSFVKDLQADRVHETLLLGKTGFPRKTVVATWQVYVKNVRSMSGTKLPNVDLSASTGTSHSVLGSYISILQLSECY